MPKKITVAFGQVSSPLNEEFTLAVGPPAHDQS